MARRKDPYMIVPNNRGIQMAWYHFCISWQGLSFWLLISSVSMCISLSVLVVRQCVLVWLYQLLH
jgi:hypothetical protein